MTHPITKAESAAEVSIDGFYRPGNLLRYGLPEDASFALQQAVRQFQFGGDPIEVPYAFNCQARNISVQSDGFPKPGQQLSEGFSIY